MARAGWKHLDFFMSFTSGSRFAYFMICPVGIIGSDDSITIADILSRRSIGRIGLILLKNLKNPASHFSAKIRCIRKAGPVRTERAIRAAHIAKALIWPTPSPKLPAGALQRNSSTFLRENRVFQHNRLRAVIRCGLRQGLLSGRPARLTGLLSAAERYCLCR